MGGVGKPFRCRHIDSCMTLASFISVLLHHIKEESYGIPQIHLKDWDSKVHQTQQISHYKIQTKFICSITIFNF